MQIPIPLFLVRAWHAFVAWGNVVVWSNHRSSDNPNWKEEHLPKLIEIVRLDLLMVFFFAFCTGWYGYWQGWHGALMGSVMFIVISALALFVRRS